MRSSTTPARPVAGCWLAKAARLGLTEIEARQFLEDHEPDYIGRAPDDLPY